MKYKRIKRNEKRATKITPYVREKKQNDPYNKTVKKRKLNNNTKGRLKEGSTL